MFFWPSFWPRTVLTGYAGRPSGRPTCTDLCTSAGTVGRSAGRSTGPESLALCIWAVDRTVDRKERPALCIWDGRPHGRPVAASGQNVTIGRSTERYTIQESEKTYARRTTFQAGGSSRSTTRPAPRDFADGCSFQVHVISTASKGPVVHFWQILLPTTIFFWGL